MRLRVWVPGHDCPLVGGPEPPTRCLAAPNGCGHCPFQDAEPNVHLNEVRTTRDGMSADVTAPDAHAAAGLLRHLRDAGEPVVLVWGLPGSRPDRPVVVRDGFGAIQAPTDALGDLLHAG